MQDPPFNGATVVVMDLGDRWWILSPLERPVCLSQIIGRHRENQDKSYQNPFNVPRIQNKKIDVEWCRDIKIGQTTNIHSSTNPNGIKIMFSIAFRCTFGTKREREREKKNLMCTVSLSKYVYILYRYIFYIYIYIISFKYYLSWKPRKSSWRSSCTTSKSFLTNLAICYPWCLENARRQVWQQVSQHHKPQAK